MGAEVSPLNGIEKVSLLAIASVAGNLAGLDAGWLDMLSAGFIAVRVVHNSACMYQTCIVGPWAKRRRPFFLAVWDVFFRSLFSQRISRLPYRWWKIFDLEHNGGLYKCLWCG